MEEILQGLSVHRQVNKSRNYSVGLKLVQAVTFVTKGGTIKFSVRRRRLAGEDGGTEVTFIFLDFFIFSL